MMAGWDSRIGFDQAQDTQAKTPEENEANMRFFKIGEVNVLDGDVSVEMVKRSVDAWDGQERTGSFDGDESGEPELNVVPEGERGDALVEAVVNAEFIRSFKRPGSEAVSVMGHYGFLPLGKAKDGGNKEAVTLYVLINSRNAALGVTPYMSDDVLRNMTAVLAENVPGKIAVRLVRVESSVVNRLIDFVYYNIEPPQQSLIDDTTVTKPLSVDPQEGESGVIAQARSWFREALNQGASDIHIEAMDNGVGRIRLRVNGILEIHQEYIPLSALRQIVTWVKAQSRMDIAEDRKPLDGSVRISFTDSGVERLVDVRISTIPTAFGTKMVMRLLDPGRLAKLTRMGLGGAIWDKGLLKKFDAALRMRDGIVLVTGPTGSGKTSTLNVALTHLLKDEKDGGVFGDTKNISTIEDPIEYNIPGANQTQTNDAAGVTFAKMLRALLRQDPDIVLVGEIRDPETAQIAVQAALTGHLILATLHTNDALGAVDRLKDLGISPFLIGSTLRMTQAQRLVRTLCTECCRGNRITGDDLRRKIEGCRQIRTYGDRLLEPDATVYDPSPLGCAHCKGGYAGRIAVMEMVPTSPSLVTAIEQNLSSRQLYAAAMADGFKPMLQNGVEMIRAGITSIAEMESIALTSIADEDE